MSSKLPELTGNPFEAVSLDGAQASTPLNPHVAPQLETATVAAQHAVADWPWRYWFRQVLQHQLSLAVLTLLSLLLAWWLANHFQWIPELLLPAPATVFHSLLTLLDTGYMDVTLGAHLSASLLRIASALGLALLLAIPTGLLIGLNRIGRGLLDPLIELYRPVPPLAYLPLMVIWFGIGELSKVLLITLAIFAPLVIATSSGVRRVATSRIQAARSLGANRWQLLRFVILPSALPDILTGLRIALGIGWSTLVAAELIAATEGIGFMVYTASKFMITDVVLAGIFVIAFVALAMELGLRRLQAWITPWQHDS